MAEVSADYVVLEAGNGSDLRKQVKTYLQDNWLPLGGVIIVAMGDDNYFYAQAMTFNVDVD